MRRFILLAGVSLLIGIASVAIESRLSHKPGRPKNICQLALGLYAMAGLLFLAYLFINHVGFPLNLDLMEGTVLQHFERAARFEPVYPAPSPTYVPFAYNPLYYVISVPFSWLFGVNLFTLRFVAILGAIGCGLIIFLAVRQRTGSGWWGLIALGVYTAAYRAMDAYLDTAHADSWLIFSALLGSYIISKNRSRAWNLAGLMVLISSFWFKQHGALFVAGGLIYLTLKAGLKQSWPYWLASVIFGPIFYIFVGPPLFGPYFHYFTWEVPGRWSSLDISTVRRILHYAIRFFPVLSLAGSLTVLRSGLSRRFRLDIWEIQFVFAALTGLMGSLDAGSSDNVFIPLSIFCIVLGTCGLHALGSRSARLERFRPHIIALFVTFGVLVYNPKTVITSPEAGRKYDELVHYLRTLQGTVYAPSLGQLQRGFSLYPAAHWVALEDMIRRPGFDTRNQPMTRKLLEPVLFPKGPAFILANVPLKSHSIEFLEEYYDLESDLGDRFIALRVLPKRWDHGWPRYVYRYRRTTTDNANFNKSGLPDLIEYNRIR